MTRRGISKVVSVAIVVALLVAVGIGYYVLVPLSGGTRTSSSSSSSSTSSHASSSGQAVVCTQSQTATGNVTVTIMDFSFTPANLTIKAGESVQWFYNPSGNTEHEVVSNTGLFQGNALTPGTKYTCTFNQVGVFAYHCMFHPTVMKGNVAVT